MGKGKIVLTVFVSFIFYAAICFLLFVPFGRKEWEKNLTSCVTFGQDFYDLGVESGYRNSIGNFKMAAFLDKFFVRWNDNTDIPEYYRSIGLAYSNLEKYDKALAYQEKSAAAYKKYCKDSDYDYAIANVLAMLAACKTNDLEKALYHGKEGAAYFEALPEEEQGIQAAYDYIWLANIYNKKGDYDAAAGYFEKGIPIMYEKVDWGFGNDENAILIAGAYKTAAAVYGKLGKTEKEREYREKYEEFMWYRDLAEEDLEEVVS